uniref:RNA polymerase subunit H/Rpb5 C-terminal domain-containing protein n=1 Tax=viral metagenome TaxID=1070528 RepID=A0A6C0AST5_9ZZZZ
MAASTAHAARADAVGVEQHPPQWSAMRALVARNQAACKGAPHAALAHSACVASVMLWSRGLVPCDAAVHAPLVHAHSDDVDTTGVPAAHAEEVRAVHHAVARHVPRIKQCAVTQELWCVLSQWTPSSVERPEVHPATQRVWLVAPRPRAQSRVRKPDVVELAVHAMQQGIERVVVLMPSAATFNHHCRQAVRDAQEDGAEGRPPIVFEVIEYSQLCGVKPMHVLVPRMHVVPRSEHDDVLRAWAADGAAPHDASASLPRMLSSDAMARWFGWSEGTLVRYTARLGHGTAAFDMVRRVVEENTASSTYSASGERKRASGWIIV